MPASPDLVSRSGDLKRDLLEFARARFASTIKRELQRSLGKVTQADEGKLIDFLDGFVLQRRLPDGRTVVEHFVDAHPELPEAERAMLNGWRDVVEGIFEVQQREGETLTLDNLIDELTYRTRSNRGPSALAPLRKGSFVIARLLPVGDEWVLSGISRLLPASARAELYQVAAQTVFKHPTLLFRNPEKLKQGWELQRKERQEFVDFFGSDLVVLPGHRVAERLRAFRHYQLFEVRDGEGLSAADRAKRAYGALPPEPEMPLSEDLRGAETVALAYDAVDGLNFLLNYAVVEETFAHPELAAKNRHRRGVLGYLEDESILPFVLRRLAERDPESASQVFRQVLKQPGFSWEQDGEALLRRHKASYYERPPLPSITPIGGALGRTALADHATGRTAALGQLPQRTTRSPSQRKRRR